MIYKSLKEISDGQEIEVMSFGSPDKMIALPQYTIDGLLRKFGWKNTFGSCWYSLEEINEFAKRVNEYRKDIQKF